jgi:hypothetical protein
MSRKVVVFLVLFSFLVRGGVGDEDASPSAPRHDVDECGHVRKRSSAHARRKRINLPSVKKLYQLLVLLFLCHPSCVFQLPPCILLAFSDELFERDSQSGD